MHGKRDPAPHPCALLSAHPGQATQSAKRVTRLIPASISSGGGTSLAACLCQREAQTRVLLSVSIPPGMPGLAHII